MMGQCLAEKVQQFIGAPGFSLVPENPAFVHRIHRHIHFTPGRRENTDNGRMRLSELVQQLFAVHPGHSLVGHHHGNIAVIPEGQQG